MTGNREKALDMTLFESRPSDSSQPAWPLLTLGLLLAAELAHLSGGVLVGACAHLAVTLVVLWHAAATDAADVRAYLLAFALIPVSRLVVDGLPSDVIRTYGREGLVAFSLVIGAWQVRRWAGPDRPRLASRPQTSRWVEGALFVLFLTAVSGLAARLLGARFSPGVDLPWQWLALAGGGLSLLISVVEASVLVGLLLPAANALMGPLGGVCVMALLWSGRYGGLPLPYMAVMGLEGIALASLATWTRSWPLAALAHWLMTAAFFLGAATTGVF
jgi:hypothetical protein